MSSKRSRPKSSSAAPSDFKRLKAKVGKRAPQKLNATSTSFKTKSINVKKQGAIHGYGDQPTAEKSSTGVFGSISPDPSSSTSDASLLSSTTPKYLTVTSLPSFPNANGKPFTMVIRQAMTHPSVKERLNNANLIVKLLKGDDVPVSTTGVISASARARNSTPSAPPPIPSTLPSDRCVYMSSLYSPLFAPGVYNLLTPLICSLMTDAKPMTGKGNMEVMAPDKGREILELMIEPGGWRGGRDKEGEWGRFKGEVQKIFKYCIAAMNGMDWEVVKSGVRCFNILIRKSIENEGVEGTWKEGIEGWKEVLKALVDVGGRTVGRKWIGEREGEKSVYKGVVEGIDGVFKGIWGEREGKVKGEGGVRKGAVFPNTVDGRVGGGGCTEVGAGVKEDMSRLVYIMHGFIVSALLVGEGDDGRIKGIRTVNKATEVATLARVMTEAWKRGGGGKGMERARVQCKDAGCKVLQANVGGREGEIMNGDVARMISCLAKPGDVEVEGAIRKWIKEGTGGIEDKADFVKRGERWWEREGSVEDIGGILGGSEEGDGGEKAEKAEWLKVAVGLIKGGVGGELGEVIMEYDGRDKKKGDAIKLLGMVVEEAMVWGGRVDVDIWGVVEGVTRRLGGEVMPRSEVGAKVGKMIEDKMLECLKGWGVRRKVEGRKKKTSDIEIMDDAVFEAMWRALKMSRRFGEINDGDWGGLGIVGGWKREGVFDDVMERFEDFPPSAIASFFLGTLGPLKDTSDHVISASVQENALKVARGMAQVRGTKGKLPVVIGTLGGNLVGRLEGKVEVGMWAALRIEEVVGGAVEGNVVGEAVGNVVKWIGEGGGGEEWERVVAELVEREEIWKDVGGGDWGDGLVKVLVKFGRKEKGRQLLELSPPGFKDTKAGKDLQRLVEAEEDEV